MKKQPVPAHLGQEMREFWAHLTSEYDFAAEHCRILQLACEAFQRSQACRAKIEIEGLMLDGKRHPLLGCEAKSMELFLRAIGDLGLEKEVAGATK